MLTVAVKDVPPTVEEDARVRPERVAGRTESDAVLVTPARLAEITTLVMASTPNVLTGTNSPSSSYDLLTKLIDAAIDDVDHREVDAGDR